MLSIFALAVAQTPELLTNIFFEYFPGLSVLFTYDNQASGRAFIISNLFRFIH